MKHTIISIANILLFFSFLFVDTFMEGLRRWS